MIPLIKILKAGNANSGYRNRPNSGIKGKRGGSEPRNRIQVDTQEGKPRNPVNVNTRDIQAHKPQIDVVNQHYGSNIRTPATLGEPETISAERKKHLDALAAHYKELETLSTTRTRHGSVDNYYRDLGLEEMRGKFLLMPEGPDKEAIRPKLIQAYKEAEDGYPAYFKGLQDKIYATRKRIESLKYKIEDTYHSPYATPESIKARNALTAVSRKQDMSLISEIEVIERKQAELKAAQEDWTRLRYSSAKLNQRVDEVNTDIDYELADKQREIDRTAEDLADHISQYTKLKKKTEVAAAKYIYASESTPLPIKTDKTLIPIISDRAMMQEGIDMAQKLIGKDREWKTSIKMSVAPQDGRAYHSSSESEIQLYHNSTARTVVHELGHAVEAEHPEILSESAKFLERRSSPAFRDSLARLYPESGYAPTEITWKDNWLNDYVGKEYISYKNSKGERKLTASEVMSMGMEYMAFEPTRFARMDPDHFHYVFNTLKKLQRGESG